MSTNENKTTVRLTLAAVAFALSAVVGCSGSEAAADEATSGEDHLESADRGLTPIAGSARIDLAMVQLRDEVIVSEVAETSDDDIKPGFEIELFAPTTLRPIAGVHGANGLELAAREMAVVNFAPVSAVARRSGGRQDAALYLDTPIDPSGVYMLPTETSANVAYTGHAGTGVTEAVCDFSTLPAEDSTPYPGMVNAMQLVDGEVHGAVVSMNTPGQIKIRLVAQVEHCAGPITNAAQAKAEPRLCYEKLTWLKANGGARTELGRLSGYRAPLATAQSSFCGD